MGKSQKKRLLAASERFRRNYFHYFYEVKGRTYMHLESRIPNHERAWK